MGWFTKETLQFLKDLAANNEREWFHANKKRYETVVKSPLEEFAAEMIERMRDLDPTIAMLPKEAVSRIHRDTRFSKDKTPYKTNVYIVVSGGGKKAFHVPGLYFSLAADQLHIASGLYMLEPDQLAAVRRHLKTNPKELAERLGDVEFRKYFDGIQGEANKILPPEFREAAAKEPLLFNKQFYYWKEHSSKEALREDLPEWVMAHMKAAWPMNVFLSKPL